MPSNQKTPPDRSPLVALQYRDYRFLLVGALSFGFGANGLQVANLWQVYELSGSAFQLGLTGLFQALPLLFFGILGGALADVVERRKLIIIAQSLRLAVTLVLATLTQTGLVQVWHIYVCTFLNATFMIVDRPARLALTAGVVREEHLFNAIALQNTASHGIRLIAPSLAGLSIAFLGAGPTYYLTSLGTIVVLLCTLPVQARPITAREGNSWSKDTLLGGLRYIAQSNLLVGLILLDTGLTVFGSFRPLVPVFAKDVLAVGATGMGMLLSAPAVGGILGSGFVMMLGNPNWKGRIVLVTTLIFGVLVIPFGYSQWFPLSLVLAAFLGFCDAVGASTRQTTIQVSTPDELRGRVTSVHQISSMGANSLGSVEIGIAASLLGPSGGLAFGGVVCLLIVAGVAYWWTRTGLLNKNETEPTMAAAA